MNTLPQDIEQLEKLIHWCTNQEQYLHRLKQHPATTPEYVKEYETWLEQFTKLRKKLEGQKKAGQLPHKLYNQAYRLYQQFSHYIQTKQKEWETRPIDSGTPIQPVPIGEHTLPPLPYPYNALEPYIDEQTMRLHHDIHHKSYVDGLNKAEKELKKARDTNDYSLIKHWEREAAFHGAGHYLHTIFWNNMKPRGGGKPTGFLAREIERSFGSFEKFKAHFSHAAEKVEGSGWAILVWSPRAHRLEILQAEKHQNLTQQDVVPLLVLDVWEHAYYLKYQNRRKDYINAWWNVVNWSDVAYRLQEAQKLRWKPY
jgi:Fe-Mn family superoxide dismutase